MAVQILVGYHFGKYRPMSPSAKSYLASPQPMVSWHRHKEWILSLGRTRDHHMNQFNYSLWKNNYQKSLARQPERLLAFHYRFENIIFPFNPLNSFRFSAKFSKASFIHDLKLANKFRPRSTIFVEVFVRILQLALLGEGWLRETSLTNRIDTRICDQNVRLVLTF